MCSKRAVNWLCGSAQGTATHFTLCVGYSTRGSRQWGKVRNWHLFDSATFGPRGPPCPLQATKFWAGEPGGPLRASALTRPLVALWGPVLPCGLSTGAPENLKIVETKRFLS